MVSSHPFFFLSQHLVCIISYPTYILRVGKVGIIQAGIPWSEHGIHPTQYTEYQLIAHLTRNIISHIFIVLPIHTYLALARYVKYREVE